jgi:hypothetical protein
MKKFNLHPGKLLSFILKASQVKISLLKKNFSLLEKKISLLEN